MPDLGVNIDHIATIRQARQGREPDPVWAAVQAELGGADGITLHLREDRKHIQVRDLMVLRETVHVKLNLEMAAIDSMIEIALEAEPEQITLVPENREEVTTEGGLDVVAQEEQLTACIDRFREAGISVCLFIDPEESQIAAAGRLGVETVELNTGKYADAGTESGQDDELEKLTVAGSMTYDHDLALSMGHGLNYHNVRAIAEIMDLQELNIGHSIISRAVFVGMERAVREMKDLITVHS